MILLVGYNIYLINARERVCLTNPTGSVTVALSQELPFFIEFYWLIHASLICTHICKVITSYISSLNLWRNKVKSVTFPMMNSGTQVNINGTIFGNGNFTGSNVLQSSLVAISDSHVAVAK